MLVLALVVCAVSNTVCTLIVALYVVKDIRTKPVKFSIFTPDVDSFRRSERTRSEVEKRMAELRNESDADILRRAKKEPSPKDDEQPLPE